MLTTPSHARCASPNNTCTPARQLLARRVVALVALMALGCADEDLDLRALRIQGVVVDAETKKPMPGLNVSVYYEERLAWWQKLMLTPDGPREPRRGSSTENWTNSAGAFSVDVRAEMERVKDSGQQTWPQEMFQVQYFMCGYEQSIYRVKDEYPFRVDEMPLILGVPQVVEMHRAQPGSRYYGEKC